MTVLYPVRYAMRMVDLNELKRLSRFDLMDPAYAARLESWLVSRNGHIGIGGAYRITQPTKPGFAPDGKSFHQLQRFASGPDNFMAVDLVCRNGDNVHRAPRWDEVPRQGSGHPDIFKFGLHCNVNGEPWHIQAVEVDGWEGWVDRGRHRPDPNFQLPTPPVIVVPDPPVVVVPPTPVPTPTPDPVYGPGDRVLRVTSPQMSGLDVAFLQGVIKEKAGQQVTVDGNYGEQTAAGVRNVQTWFHLTADGIVGPNTWAVIIDMSKPPPPPPPTPTYAPGDRTLRLTDPPMNGMDVAFVQSVCKNQAGQAVTIDGYYGAQTVAAVKNVQAWFKFTADGVVGPLTWELLIDLSKA
jgi:peptidoglycan hydrolase-like protein with peptidoglycan-binding domain